MKKNILIAGVVVLLLNALTQIEFLRPTSVGLSQQVDSQWAQVQNVYQRRADLIPNLVQTVQGSANFEKTTLEAVTEARASVGRVTIDASKAPSDAARLQQFQAAQGQLSNALSHLMVVSEAYPDLKSSQNFRDLQAQLEGTENQISVERERFQRGRSRLRYFRAFLPISDHGVDVRICRQTLFHGRANCRHGTKREFQFQ